MNIKLGKFEADIPLTALVIMSLVIDNAIANLCKKSAVVEVANSSKSEES